MAENYNIWNLYGLKGNPFTTDPLSAYDGELPIEKSFFGREAEVEKVKKIIYSNKTSRLLVYGDIGIGKTTFVNFIKHQAVKDGYFTPFGELGLEYDWSPEEFMLNTINIIFTTIDRTKSLKEKINPELAQKMNVLFGIDRGYSGGVGLSVSAFGAGIGANIDKGQSFGVPKLNSATLKLLLQEVLDELIRLGFKGTILHFNNLELVQDKGETQLRRIMNGIRDFLQVKGAHFIFVSDTKLYEMFQQIKRVEDIFEVPILILPFKIDEVKQIINTRIKLLKVSSDINPIYPFDDETLAILFKLYSGNLRGILRSLMCAVNETVTSKPRTITPNILKISLYRFAKNRFLSNFTRNTNALKILKRILDRKETTNKLLAEHFKMLPQNVSHALTTLREVGAIKLSREEGRSRYYVPSQEAMWLLLEPSEDWEGQTTL